MVFERSRMGFAAPCVWPLPIYITLVPLRHPPHPRTLGLGLTFFRVYVCMYRNYNSGVFVGVEAEYNSRCSEHPAGVFSAAAGSYKWPSPPQTRRVCCFVCRVISQKSPQSSLYVGAYATARNRLGEGWRDRLDCPQLSVDARVVVLSFLTRALSCAPVCLFFF